MFSANHAICKPKRYAPYLIILAAIVLLTLLMNKYIGGITMVYGTSMEPTLNSGNFVAVNKLAKEYSRFDIVIINMPQEIIIKRIIGIPGDTIQIKAGYVHINGEQIEDVANENTTFAGTAFNPLTLGEGEYFVLGDNRSNSEDSRYEEIGIIKHEQIIGKALFAIIPIKSLY